MCRKSYFGYMWKFHEKDIEEKNEALGKGEVLLCLLPAYEQEP